MRICLFTPNFLPALGGAERMADILVRGLIARGHEVMVLAQHSGPEAAGLPYPVRRYRRPPAQHLWPELLAAPIWKAHRAWRFDLMLAFYSYPTGYAGGLLKDLLGYKLIINTRGGDLYPNFHGLRKPRVRRTIAAAYRRADRIITLSDYLTRRLREEVPDVAAPIDEIPNGIDLAAHDRGIAAARAAPPPVAGAFELATRPFVLHLARLAPVKRHDLALRAVAATRQYFNAAGARYVIVGEGQSMEPLRRLAAELGVNDIVVFLGSRTGVEKAWLYDHARFLVSTSREEGMPNVILEAMASGLPALASDIGPHRELIEGKQWGELFRYDDADDLAAKMRRMMDADLTLMRDAARALRPSYDLNHMLDAYGRACRATLGA